MNYTLVEVFTEDGKEQKTCISHRGDKAQAEKELAQWVGISAPVEENFHYELIEFEVGDYCPVCQRSYYF